jgi:hypothetical protein
MQQIEETPEALCNRLNLDVNDWLYEDSTKLYLLPLEISSAVYRETPYEGFKIIYNAKIKEFLV